MTALIETAVYVSVTALFVLLFKQIFNNRLSAKWHVLIWLVLAVRMIVPSLPQSSFSVFNAFDLPRKQEAKSDFSEIIPEETVNTDIFMIPEAEKPTEYQSDNLPNKQTTEKQTGLSKTDKTGQISADSIVSLSRRWGTAVLLLYFVLVYIINLAKIKKQGKKAEDNALQILQDCKNTVGVKRKVSLVYYGKSPMLMGVIKPVIVLPEDFSDKEKQDIIIHELCHLKNGDIFALWLAVFLLCTSWYNPIIWLCFFTFRRDIEVYCDSRVLEYAVNKKEYAELLVRTALKRNSFIAGTTSLQNGEKEVERRIKYMAYFKKPKVVLTIVIAVIAVIISVICLTNAKNDDKTKEPAVKLNDEIYEAFIKGNKKVEINENQYSFAELSDSQMYYCFSDMNNDGNNEMHLKTSAEYYIFTVKNGNMMVWYHGSVYENPTKEGNIVYLRNGGAPDNVTERFITLDDDGNVIKEDSAGKYDEDCNGSFDRFFFNGEEIAENSFNDLTAPYRLQTIIYMNNRTEIEPCKLKVLENTANFYLEDRTDEYYYEIYDNNGKTILSDTSEKCPNFNLLDTRLYELTTGYGTFAWQSIYINVETGYISEPYDNPFYLTNGVIAYVNTAEALADDGTTADDIILIRIYDLHEQKHLYAVDADFSKESSVTYQIEYEDNTHIAVTYYTENGQKENRKVIEVPPLSGTFSYNNQEQGEIISSLPIDGEIKLLYASGAGAWGDYLHINPDGSFSGEYHDSDMGIADENNYPKGTVFIDRYSGRFGDFIKIDDYTYLLTVLEETHEFEPNAEWIEDGIRFVSTSPENPDIGTEYVLCLPGKPLSEIPKSVKEWELGNDSENTLTGYCLYPAQSPEIGYFQTA